MSNFLKLAAVGLAMATVSGGAASAADLGRPAPAAVDYVRVCDSYGAGFFYIPGSETCLRIGGRVRADMSYSEAVSLLRPGLIPGLYRRYNEIATLARARVDFDAITRTDFGVVQSVAKVYFQNGTFHDPIDPITFNNRPTAVPTTDLYEAFIRIGSAPAYTSTSVTAGLTFSYFNLPYFLTYSNPFTADQRTNLFAVSFASNGFLAALSVEDPSSRRGFIGFGGTTDPALGSNYGGVKYPDLIGTAQYENQTFAVKAAVAAHHVLRARYIESGSLLRSNGVDEWGWAAQIGGRFNVTSAFSVYGGIARTSGASNFAGVSADDDRFGGGIGFAVVDGFNPLPRDRFKPTKITSGHVGAGYSFSEKLRVAASFGYADVDDAISFGAVDFEIRKAIAMIEYKPVKDLAIGVEVGYFDQDFGRLTAFQAARIRDYDRFSALLRVDRRF